MCVCLCMFVCVCVCVCARVCVCLSAGAQMCPKQNNFLKVFHNIKYSTGIDLNVIQNDRVGVSNRVRYPFSCALSYINN